MTEQGTVQNEQGTEEQPLMILGMMMEPDSPWELGIQAPRKSVEGAINKYIETGEIRLISGRTTTIHNPYAVAMFQMLGAVSHEELAKQAEAQVAEVAEVIPSEEGQE